MPGKGVDVNEPSHQTYLQQLCADFKKVMIDGINRTANDVTEVHQDALCLEIIKHLQFANSRGKSHLGRENELFKVRQYLTRVRRLRPYRPFHIVPSISSLPYRPFHIVPSISSLPYRPFHIVPSISSLPYRPFHIVPSLSGAFAFPVLNHIFCFMG